MKRSISARAFGALGVAAVLLLTGACSGGSDDEAKDDKKTDDSSEQADSSEETETTALSDDEFIGQVDELTGMIDEAGTDLCKIVAVAQEDGPASSATTPAQVESLIAAQVSMLRALAGVEPVDEANAAVLNGYADKLQAAGEEADYSVELLTSEEFIALQADPALAPAIGVYQTRAQSECPELGLPAGGADGTASEEPTTTVAP